MMINVLKSKIHRATITDANLHYIGSLGLDEDLIEAANLVENEQVHVLNVNNGERLVTYVIKAPRGSGIVSLNGAAARKAMVGDLVIVAAYALIDAREAMAFKPAIVLPDPQNKLP